MLYAVSLRIEYTYEAPAAAARHVLRVLPANLNTVQRLIVGHIDVFPVPAQRDVSIDFFGTSTLNVAIRSTHSQLVYSMQARVERADLARLALDSMGLPELALALQQCRSLEGQSPLHFTAASRRSPIVEHFTNYARGHFMTGMPVADIVRSIGEALNRDMVFDAEATTVDTPALDAFANRRGVCQDFSHIMISCLRGIGIPAGYVSGFLRTKPPPGQPRLEGADAMHAWVRAWCGPVSGWLEYDPTNAMFASGDHIVIGYGRDYSDISPVKGVSRLSGGQTTRQSVDVVSL
ncbi:MAG: transglutaminase family protein [Beijerinckiaceae bacterium]|nr:transglutaminase family protein [Beijerinckiaceae bacterium]